MDSTPCLAEFETVCDRLIAYVVPVCVAFLYFFLLPLYIYIHIVLEGMMRDRVIDQCEHACV